jgi:hypothetical protein
MADLIGANASREIGHAGSNKAMTVILKLLGWLAATFFIAGGASYLLWALQSASFSAGPGDNLSRAIYTLRTETFFPMGILSVGIGVLFLCVLLRGHMSSRK